MSKIKFPNKMPTCAVLKYHKPKYKVGDVMRFGCYIVTIVAVAGMSSDGEYYYDCKFQEVPNDTLWESSLKPLERVKHER